MSECLRNPIARVEKGLYNLLFNHYQHIHKNLGPNKHGLVTNIQVNVYIGNTLSWLNGG